MAERFQIQFQNWVTAPLPPPPRQSHQPSIPSRLQFGARSPAAFLFQANTSKPGLLGSGPSYSCTQCLAQGHVKAQCTNRPRCSCCLRFGNSLEICRLAPQSPRPSRISTGNKSPFPNPGKLIHLHLGQSHDSSHPSVIFSLEPQAFLLPPVTIPWNRQWRITAPDFLDDRDEVNHGDEVNLRPPDHPSPTSVVPHRPQHFSSFGEFTTKLLVSPFPKLTVHIF